MNISAEKRFISLLLAVVLLISLMPMLPMDVTAAAVNVNLVNNKINVTTTGEATNNNGVITATAAATSTKDNCGNVTWHAQSNTATVKNTSGAEAIVKFSYTANATSFSINNTAQTEMSGTYSATLAADGTVTLKIETAAAEGSSASLALSGFEVVENIERTLVFPKVTVGGTATAGGVNLSTMEADTYTTVAKFSPGVAVTASPASGYTFLGWVDTNNNLLSTTANTTLTPTADGTISPLFVKTASTQAYWKTSGKLFTDLNVAAETAKSGDSIIVLLRSATLPAGDYTIPAGVTLLIPINASHTLYTETPEYVAGVATFTAPTAYCTLTMVDGANLIVNGDLSVSSKHTTIIGGKVHGSSPVQTYGHIKMNEGSTINVSGNLYCWGYISGDGVVTAESGAVVYENMQFTDFRGGSIASQMLGNKAFMMSQYYVQNIETKLVLKPGSTEFALATVEASGSIASSAVKFIAPDGGMFKSGANTTVIKDYNPADDRLYFTINGDLELNTLTISVTAPIVGKVTIDSANYILPINSNIDITIESGTTTINQDLALLPGSRLTVGKNAIVQVATDIEVYVYDRDDYVGKGFTHSGADLVCAPYSPTAGRKVRSSADLVDAVVDVNGLIILQGSLYTTAGGASIISTGKTGKIVYMANAGTATVTYQNDTSGKSVEVPVTSAKLLNGDLSTYVATAGTTAASGYAYNATTNAWESGNAVVTFDPNGGTGTAYSITVAMGYILQGSGNSAAIPDATTLGFSNGDCAFLGWNTQKNGTGTPYAAGTTLTVTESITLYAQWQYSVYNVTWKDANGNTIYIDEVKSGEVPSFNGTTPSKASDAQYHYTFAGWATSENGTVLSALPAVTEDAVYYAVFKAEAHADTDKAAVDGKHYCDTCNYLMYSCKNENATVDHVCDYGCNTVLDKCADVNGDKDHTCDVCKKENVSDCTGGTAVEENRSEPTCGAAGSYDSVVYCSECGKEMSRTKTTIPAT